MNNKQYLYIKEKPRLFIYLDQSKTVNKEILETYKETSIEEKLIEKEIKKFYKRLVQSKSFNDNMVLAFIFPFKYIKEKINGQYIIDYLWEEKNLISFIKLESNVKNVDKKIDLIKKHNAFGISYRVNIAGAEIGDINEKLGRLFDIGQRAYKQKLIPILEAIVEMNSATKLESEALLKEEILIGMEGLEIPIEFILRLSLPTRDNAYEELINNPNILRIIANSGGHTKESTTKLLNRNPKMDPSFGRAIFEGLRESMDDEEFDKRLYSNLNELFLETKEVVDMKDKI